MSTFMHGMPFGAEPQSSGATRFRLWAPSCSSVELVVGTTAGGTARHRLERRAEGWHELTLAGLGAGSRYFFEVTGERFGPLAVPDPASRSNPEGVHAASAVVDPRSHRWHSVAWHGRPWNEAVLYELHVGTFTPEGTFAALESRLPYLAALGITALQLMPLAACSGSRNWGYDGVLHYAPASAYGTPEQLKSLIDAAHACGLMVLLDVVYNHFGPDGNYLHVYCPEFFNPAEHTPWGPAINLDGPESRTVRDFYVHNALYWIQEYRFDGLRLDAVHALRDRSDPDLVEEIALALREGPGREREVHLVLENHRNEAHYLARDPGGRPRVATAQWNDDLHHALHVWLTGEHAGYYVDFAEHTHRQLGRALAEGFAFQGEFSSYRARARGESSASLPPAAFIGFLQNHDMIGNRARGERIDRIALLSRIEAAYVCLLLAPQIPMLFMGEEFAASAPFLYFCDVDADLAHAIADGRRLERARFASFGASGEPSAHPTANAPAPEAGGEVPEPNDVRAFLASKITWPEALLEPHRSRRALIGELLALRRRHGAHLARITRGGTFSLTGGLLRVEWPGPEPGCWRLWVNLSSLPRALKSPPAGQSIYRSPGARTALELAPWDTWVTLGD